MCLSTDLILVKWLYTGIWQGVFNQGNKNVLKSASGINSWKKPFKTSVKSDIIVNIIIWSKIVIGIFNLQIKLLWLGLGLYLWY
jgi:hypothetical protein